MKAALGKHLDEMETMLSERLSSVSLKFPVEQGSNLRSLAEALNGKQQ